MPLLILCGFPCSGKSRISEAFKDYINSIRSDATIHLVSDSDRLRSVGRSTMYLDSVRERQMRSELKSDVQRLLNRDSIVILDALNYIKGMNYIVHPKRARQLSARYAIPGGVSVTGTIQSYWKHYSIMVHCEISSSTARNWNEERPAEERYSIEVFEALLMRFEAPDSQNRWDSPLFTLQAGEQPPFQDVYNSLFFSKAPPPNLSTQSPLAAGNFLFQLDKLTQEIVSIILELQKSTIIGEELSIPGTNEKIVLSRHVTIAELSRLRRQFISYTKMHPEEDHGKLSSMFIQYITRSFSAI